SAVPMSPTRRASPAMSRADSIRQIASIMRCASMTPVSPRPGPSSAFALRGSMARAPLHALGLEDLTDLVGAGVERRALEPFEGLVHRAHLPEPVPRDKLLGLRPRSVDDPALLAFELKALALRARVEAAIPDHHSRLDQLFVELLELRHRLRRRRSRRPALVIFLRQYQHPHIGPLLLDLVRGSLFEASLIHRTAGGVFDTVDRRSSSFSRRRLTEGPCKIWRQRVARLRVTPQADLRRRGLADHPQSAAQSLVVAQEITRPGEAALHEQRLVFL